MKRVMRYYDFYSKEDRGFIEEDEIFFFVDKKTGESFYASFNSIPNKFKLGLIVEVRYDYNWYSLFTKFKVYRLNDEELQHYLMLTELKK